MKLQETRKKEGLSQSELAKAANVPVRMIQEYEQGRKDIDGASLNRLCDLAAALHVKIYEILENEELVEKVKRTA
ncbi:MAG: XRE family transcriptional regulator [Clostridiales bacterium]|nr:XRE family transcriptional regulator [Clostridiales bacterium]